MYEMFLPSTVRGQCAFPGDGLRIVPQVGEGFAVVRNDVRLTIIRPTRTYGSGELIDASLDASRPIRLKRQVAYECPATLECNVGGMTLLPIAGSETRLSLPFRFTKGTKALPGKLVLGDLEPSRASGCRTLPDLSVTVAFRVKLSLYREVAGLWLWRNIL
jgi:hypothetical protein